VNNVSRGENFKTSELRNKDLPNIQSNRVEEARENQHHRNALINEPRKRPLDSIGLRDR
jgi:hypothetical protein